MKLSTRGRYGIKLLIDLAEHREEEKAPLADIARRQRLSESYLEQVATFLRHSGFIRSTKGSSGGYSLARHPTEIMLGDVMRVLEGDLLILYPPIDGEQETPLRRCLRKSVFEKINALIADYFDNTSLESLLEERQDDLA
jgi:Rrf2 family protein